MTDRLIPADHPASLENRASQPLAPLDAMCEATVERLAQKLPGRVMVQHFPDKPTAFDFEGYDAAALVIYDGSRFDKAGQIGAQGLREEVRLVVTLLIRSLRGATGAYQMVHDVRSCLHGQSLAGLTALRPVEVVLEQESEGVFRYSLSYEAALPVLPASPLRGVSLPRTNPEQR